MSHREIFGHCAKFPRVIKISQVVIFHFTTPFSGYTLQWGIQNMVEYLQWSFFAKIPNGVELLTFSQEKLHPMFDQVENRFLAQGFTY